MIINGMIKLNFSEEKVIQVSDNPTRFISKIREGNYPLVEKMAEDGWEFQENCILGVDGYGYGMIFSKNNDKLIVKDIYYSRKYRVWEFINQ